MPDLFPGAACLSEVMAGNLPSFDLSFPVFQIGRIERQVDGLAVIIIEPEADAVRFFYCGQAGMGKLDEELVLVLVFVRLAVVGWRRLFDGGLHFPGGTIGIEDGLWLEFGIIIAPVPER